MFCHVKIETRLKLFCFCDFGDVGPEWGWAARLPLRLVGTRPALPAPAHLVSSVPSISNKELSELIEQLQKNADQVEKNIVDTEAKMQSVSARPPPPTAILSAPFGTRVLPDPTVFSGEAVDSALPPGNLRPHLELFLAFTAGVVGWTGVSWVEARDPRKHP